MDGDRPYVGGYRGLTDEQHAVLTPYSVTKKPAVADAHELRHAIDAADDERPIQKLLESKPELLAAALTGGHGRWVRPQVRLGAEYVADFLIADADSAGIHWTFVELESPRAAIFTQAGELAQKARTGVSQIRCWREWVKENLDYARKSPGSGLGLADIRPAAPGIVVVGRRADLPEGHRWKRQQHAEETRIWLHTYDWLIERATPAWLRAE